MGYVHPGIYHPMYTPGTPPYPLLHAAPTEVHPGRQEETLGSKRLKALGGHALPALLSRKCDVWYVFLRLVILRSWSEEWIDRIATG